MMQVIPKWEVRWRYIDEKSTGPPFIINADNTMQCAEWFNRINHGLRIVDYVQFNVYKEPELVTQTITGSRKNQISVGAGGE